MKDIPLLTVVYLSIVLIDIVGIISMCLMVMLFGSGILNQYDFNSMSWHILFLIGGGNVLGDVRCCLWDTIQFIIRD